MYFLNTKLDSLFLKKSVLEFKIVTNNFHFTVHGGSRNIPIYKEIISFSSCLFGEINKG